VSISHALTARFRPEGLRSAGSVVVRIDEKAQDKLNPQFSRTDLTSQRSSTTASYDELPSGVNPRKLVDLFQMGDLIAPVPINWIGQHDECIDLGAIRGRKGLINLTFIGGLEHVDT
jgi:hypothetical protein